MEKYIRSILFKNAFVFLLFSIPVISLLIPSIAAHGYEIPDVKIICQTMENDITYIAYMDEDIFGIAAIHSTDTQTPDLLWSFPFLYPIEDLILEGPFLYIATIGHGIWRIDLNHPDIPLQDVQPSPRYSLYDPFSQYPFPLSSYSVPQYTNLGFLGTFSLPYSGFLGSGWQIPQLNLSYPLTGNLGWQGLPQPSFSSLTLPGQFQVGSWYPSYNITLPNIPLITGSWLPTLPGQIYPQPTGTSTSPTVTRYRSPVAARITFDNRSDTQASGKLTLNIYDLNKKFISEQREDITLTPGISTYPVSLKRIPYDNDPDDFPENLANYILKYHFSGTNNTITGETSLFQCADKLEVHIIGPNSYYTGEITSLGVHAFIHGHPVPLKDAQVTLDFVKDGETKRIYQGTTDENGFSEGLVNIPDTDIGPGELRARVTSDLGTEVITEDIEVVRLYKILLTTDKPLYQPGQIIHIRTLTLKKPDLLPEANREIIIECEDPKGNKVFRVAQESDGFGVASADFQLGRDINLGSYTIRAIQERDGQQTTSEKQVAVERYVLPKFRVDVETDAD